MIQPIRIEHTGPVPEYLEIPNYFQSGYSGANARFLNILEVEDETKNSDCYSNIDRYLESL